MHRQTLLSIVAFCLLFAGCLSTEEPASGDEWTMAASREVAREYVMGSYWYQDYNGSGLREVGALKVAHKQRTDGTELVDPPGYYEFTYEFRVDSERLAPCVEKVRMTVPVNQGSPEDVVVSEMCES